MSELETGAVASCTGCAAPLRLEARFCSRCGAPVGGGDRPADAIAPVPTARWVELRSALQLWVLLIATSGGIAVAMRIADSESLAYDVAGTIAFAVVALGFAAGMRGELVRLLSPRRIGWSAVLAAAGAAVGLLVFIHLYSAAAAVLGIESPSLVEQYREEAWPLWSAFLLVAVCPPVTEEIAFRGFIHERLVRVGGRREALVVQAAMFSILHLLPVVFVSHFLIGLTLGWLRQRTDSLLPGMLAHGLYNGTLLAIEIWA